MRKSPLPVLVLLAGLFMGSWSCTSTPQPGHHRYPGGSPYSSGLDCPLDERNHVIWVFDDGTVTEECARISKINNHKILWLSASGSDLQIDLIVGGGKTVPFDRMKCDAPDPNTKDMVCHIDCKKDRCQTGKYNEPYHPSSLGDYYRYAPRVALLKGGDPGIMIDP
jgi:hypothetical protein